MFYSTIIVAQWVKPLLIGHSASWPVFKSRSGRGFFSLIGLAGKLCIKFSDRHTFVLVKLWQAITLRNKSVGEVMR